MDAVTFERTCTTCSHNPPADSRKSLDDVPGACWNCVSCESQGGKPLPAWKPIVMTEEKATPRVKTKPDNALAVQVGGGHYKKLAIQPVEYCHKNRLGTCESNAIKYLTRWRDKGGVEDLKKAKHNIDLLIELEGL